MTRIFICSHNSCAWALSCCYSRQGHAVQACLQLLLVRPPCPAGRYPPQGERDEPDPDLLSPAGTPLARSLGASAASDSGDGGLAAASSSLGALQLGKVSMARRDALCGVAFRQLLLCTGEPQLWL